MTEAQREMYLSHRALRHQERRQDQGGEQGRDEKAWPAITGCGRCVCADLCRSGAGAAEGAPYAAGFLAGDLRGGVGAIMLAGLAVRRSAACDVWSGIACAGLGRLCGRRAGRVGRGRVLGSCSPGAAAVCAGLAQKKGAWRLKVRAILACMRVNFLFSEFVACCDRRPKCLG
jgi:hypothetical protein